VTERVLRRHTLGYNFVADPDTGVTFRWGSALADDPLVAPWPELADISISNRCGAGCGYCYRDSRPSGDLMGLDAYMTVLDQLTHPELGSVFQVALGGGEPTEHPQLADILRATRRRGIVPNYTTNGLNWTDEVVAVTKEACGAVAVSHDPHRGTSSGLQYSSDVATDLAAAGVGMNIHFVLSAESIGGALALLEGRMDEQLSSFNAVVFLLLKPTGRAAESLVLRPGKELDAFMRLVDEPHTKLRVGFDACTVPALLSGTQIATAMVDSCEGGFFSVYVDEHGVCSPCSFADVPSERFDLREHDFAWVWGEGFSSYRKRVMKRHASTCVGCRPFSQCRGSCPYFEELHLCRPRHSAALGG
jgi:radical SAM protein with 4Fe4S-binding SPASM domain